MIANPRIIGPNISNITKVTVPKKAIRPYSA
jgi:hypothetical protein